MITEKDCIALAKKYQNKNFSYCSLLYTTYVVNTPDRQFWLQYDSEGGWVLTKYSVVGNFPFHNFEDHKDQIMDFFFKLDPSLEQQFLNRKHKKILKQPKIMEAL